MRKYAISGATLCAAGFLALVTGAVQAQQVRGKVVDRASTQPVGSVQLVLRAEDGRQIASAISDTAGSFTLRATQGGRYTVSALHVGYSAVTAPIELGATDIVEVELHLTVVATELPPLVVTGRSRGPDAYLERNGFYERQKAGFGVFINRDQIERRKPYATSDLFYGLGGIRVFTPGDNMRGKDVRMSRGGDPDCAPRVIVDNVIIRKGGREGPRDSQTLDMLIQPTNIQAIEIYRGPAELPQEFISSSSQCGVLVIWTRR